MSFKKLSFTKALPTCLAIVILSLLRFVAWFSTTSYLGFVKYIINTLARPDLYTLFTGTLFTKERYHLVYNIHWLAYPVIILLAFWVIIKRKAITWLTERLLFHYSYFFRSFKHFLQQLSKQEKLAFVAIMSLYFILSFYKVLNRNITYDEAWNYNYFISKPPYFSLILFNTYPLYHLIASSVHCIPIDPCVLTRTMSILIGGLFLSLLLFINGKLYGNAVSILIAFMLLASPFFVVYSAIMKGTLLSCLFVLVHFYATIGLIKNSGGPRYFIPYILSSFLQVASMPTSILCSIGSGVGLCLCFFYAKKYKPMSQVLCYGALAVLGSLLFYLPIIFTGGKEKLLDKQPYEGLLENLKTFFSNVSMLLWGNGYICSLVFLVGLILTIVPKNRHNLTLMAGLCSIIILCLFSYVHPLPDRSLSFILIPYLTISAYLFSRLLNNKYARSYPRTRLATVLLLLLVSLYPIGAYTNEYVHPINLDKTLSKRISTYMLSNHLIKCYVFHPDFWINYPEIEYYHSLQNKKWEMYNNQQNSTRYKIFNLQDGYDCIITTDSVKSSSINGYKVGWGEKNIKLFVKDPLPQKQ